jgi:hypothetical protein
MSLKYSLGAGLAALLGVGLLGAAPMAKAGESQQAEILLRGIRVEAQRVAVHARRFQELAMSPSTAWQAYDTQWNEIKPLTEGMSIKVARLEAMKTKLPEGQQKAVDGSQVLIARIDAGTHTLRTLLNENNGSIASRALRARATAVDREARQLSTAAVS